MLADDIQVKNKKLRGLQTAWLEYKPTQSKGVLIFLHGFPDDAYQWSDQLNFFREQSFTLIAPFSRGVGPSEAAEQLSRYGAHAQGMDMKAILSEVGISKDQPLWFIGHDLGVVYAWQCSRLFQKQTKGLVVLNGLNLRQMMVRLKNPIQLAKSWYMFAMQLPKVPEMVSTHFSGPVLQLAHFLGNSPPSESTTANGLGGIPQYRAFLRELLSHSFHRFPRVKCPVLVLWGKNDRVLMPPTMDEIEKDAVQPIVRMLEAGHWVQRERADDVNKLIFQFLQNKEGHRE